MTLDWTGMFTSNSSLVYEITIGMCLTITFLKCAFEFVSSHNQLRCCIFSEQCNLNFAPVCCADGAKINYRIDLAPQLNMLPLSFTVTYWCILMSHVILQYFVLTIRPPTSIRLF